MSRVERHKNEYSKEDRKALERAAGTTGAGDAKSDKLRQPAAPVRPAAEKVRQPASPAKQTDLDIGAWDQTEEEKKRARKEAKAMRDGKPEFHAGRALGGFLNFIGSLILIVAIVACLGLTVPRFAGIDQYVVVSGSMEPAIPVGSMIYSAQTEPSTLEAGDIIVFFNSSDSDTPVTHRVVENHIAEGEVITKGDANEQNDMSPVQYSNIVGKMVLHIPMLGYLAAPVATMTGKIAMGCIILAAYLLTVAGGKLKSA